MQIGTERQQQRRTRKMEHAEFQFVRICNLFRLRLPVPHRFPQLPTEQNPQNAKRGDPRHAGRQRHNRKVWDKPDSRRRGKVNIGRVADDEQQTPCVRRHKFGNQIRKRVNLRPPRKKADKGREGQNHDVVGGKDCQHRNGEIKRQKQRGLASARSAQRRRGEITEKAHLVQIHGQEGHTEEQQQNFNGVDR